MPNKHYNYGRRAEWALRKIYESNGWFVIRSAGSKSKIDLVAVFPSTQTVRFIQVKAMKRGTIADIERIKRAWQVPFPCSTHYEQFLHIKVGSAWRAYEVLRS